MSAAKPNNAGIRSAPGMAGPWEFQAEFQGQVTFAEKAMVEILDAGNGRLGPLLEEMVRVPDEPAAERAQEEHPEPAPRRRVSAWLFLPWRR